MMQPPSMGMRCGSLKKVVGLLAGFFLTFYAFSLNAASYTWVGTVGATWNTSGNWTSGGLPSFNIPNAVGDTASFNNISVGGTSISLGQAITIGGLTFTTTNVGYTFSGSALTFDVSSGSASLTITGGTSSHTINNNIVANDNLAISQGSSGTLTLGGVLSGSTAVSISTGAVTFSGSSANTLSGLVTVSSGNLTLNKSADTNAIAGDLTIASGGTVTLSANNQINDSSVVTVNGTLDLNNKNETLNNLTLTAGTITTGSGTLTLGGNVSTSAAASTATISGLLSLGSADRTFTVADGAASNDLNINAAISGTVGLIKEGDGRLRLSGSSANTYSGDTTVNTGILALAKTAGIDAIAGNVTINSGGTVMLVNSNQISSTSNITLRGGTYDLNGNSETAGALILSTPTDGYTSTINFNSAGSTSGVFANSASQTWDTHNSLIITNYSSDTFQIGSSASHITDAQLGKIVFADPNGNSGNYAAVRGSNGVITAHSSSEFSWIGNSGGLWQSGSNWDTGYAPNSDGARVFLGGETQSPITIAGNGDEVTEYALNQLRIENNATYTIQSDISLNFYSSGYYGSPGILVDEGNTAAHVIDSDIYVVQLIDGDKFGIQVGGSGSSSLTINGNISLGSDYSLMVGGSQTLTINGSILGDSSNSVSLDGSLIVNLNGTNTFSGGLSILDTNVNLGNSGTVLSDVGAVVVDGDGNTFKLGQANETIGSLAGGSSTFVNLFNGSGRTLTVGGNNTSTEYAGTIQGAGGNLTKEGTGTMVLTGNNTYTGTTLIKGGTISIGNTQALSSSSNLSFQGTGARFLMSDYGDLSQSLGTLSLLGSFNATIEYSAGVLGLLSFANTNAAAWQGLLYIVGWNGERVHGGGDHQLVVVDTTNLTTYNQLSQIRFINPGGLAAGTYGAVFSNGEIVPDTVPIPEPATVAGLSLLALLLGYRERRRLLAIFKQA